MNPKPVRQYSAPKFPTLEQAKKMDLLVEQPPFYRKKKALVLAIVLLLSSKIMGCSSLEAQGVSLLSPSPVITDEPLVPEGEPPVIVFPSEIEIRSFLELEMEELNVSFKESDQIVTYKGNPIELDYYNEDKKVGIAVMDEFDDKLWDALFEEDSSRQTYDYTYGIQADLKKPSDTTVFLVNSMIDVDGDEIILEDFHSFIEWLQAEGVL